MKYWLDVATSIAVCSFILCVAMKCFLTVETDM